MPILGLAGGVGSGKSAVARHMASLGLHVVDADRIANEALLRPEVKQQLVAWWGKTVLGADGCPDRHRIAERIFRDPAERQRLEGLIHPLVAQERERQLSKARQDPGIRGVVLDVPLLFEVGLDKVCDHVVFVEADRELRLQRVKRDRGWTEEELDRREASQIPLDRKRSQAHAIIRNDAGEAECLAQVRDLLDRILT